MPARLFPFLNVPADVLDSEGNFWNENDVCPARDASFEADPTAVAPHDLDHHDAMVRGSGGMNLIDGVGYGVEGSVEPECNFGGGQVVGDGLADADKFPSFLEAFVAHFLISASTYR